MDKRKESNSGTVGEPFEVVEPSGKDPTIIVYCGEVHNYNFQKFEKYINVKSENGDVKPLKIINCTLLLLLCVAICFLIILGATSGILNGDWQLFERIDNLICKILTIILA